MFWIGSKKNKKNIFKNFPHAKFLKKQQFLIICLNIISILILLTFLNGRASISWPSNFSSPYPSRLQIPSWKHFDVRLWGSTLREIRLWAFLRFRYSQVEDTKWNNRGFSSCRLRDTCFIVKPIAIHTHWTFHGNEKCWNSRIG